MPKTPAKRGPKQVRDKKGRFVKGQSGNPNGRRQGSRNKATLACQDLLKGESQALTRKAVEMALEGDIGALRLCVERLIPPAKDRPVVLDLPRVDDTSGVRNAIASIIESTSRGRITPTEAKNLAALIETQRKVLELYSLEDRVTALEQAMEDGV